MNGGVLAALALSALPLLTPVSTAAQDSSDLGKAYFDHLLANDCASTAGELVNVRAELYGDRRATRSGDPRTSIIGFASSGVLPPGAVFFIGDGPSSVVVPELILPDTPVRLSNVEGCP